MLPSLCRLSVGVQPRPAQPGVPGGRGEAPPSGLGVGRGGAPPLLSLPDDVLATVLAKADCRSATKLCRVLHCSESVWQSVCILRGGVWAAEKPAGRTWKDHFAYRCEQLALTDSTIKPAVQVALALPPPHVHPFYGPIADWDVGVVTEMSDLFSGATAFNGDLSRWDVSKVTDMNRMFASAEAFDSDLSRWVEKVALNDTDTRQMWRRAGPWPTTKPTEADFGRTAQAAPRPLTAFQRRRLGARGRRGPATWPTAKSSDLADLASGQVK